MLKQTLDQRLVSKCLFMCMHKTCIKPCAYNYAIVFLFLFFIGSILTIDDLNSVYEKLIKAAGNWLDLGLSLRLGHGTLSNIKDEHRDKNQTCLREMLAARLKTGPPLTYSEICRSLRAPTVARNDVAEAIEMECTGMNGHEANLDHTITVDRH